VNRNISYRAEVKRLAEKSSDENETRKSDRDAALVRPCTLRHLDILSFNAVDTTVHEAFEDDFDAVLCRLRVFQLSP
jgi:hypothetical protein